MKELVLLILMPALACHGRPDISMDGESQGVAVVSRREPKELYPYRYPQEVDGGTKAEYPVLSYSRGEGYYECPPSSGESFIGRQLNYFLLKIGAVAIAKAILAGLLLFKVPLFFLKLAFLKSFLFPVLLAPLLIHAFSSQDATDAKPADEVQMMPDATENKPRNLEERDLSARLWRSLKTFAESEECVERFACVVGAYNKDSDSGITLGRLLKLVERSSPSSLQRRLASVRKAFGSGARGESCADSNFACHDPELYIRQGSRKLQLL